jgi:hypothetical protein
MAKAPPVKMGDYELYTLAEKTDQTSLQRLQFLLDNGVDPNSKDPDRGATPLHYAANKGNIDAIEMLVDAGADPNMQNKRGRTPLHNLVEQQFDKVVLWLIQYCGADPHILDHKNLAPIDLSHAWFQTEMLKAYENRTLAVDVPEEEEYVEPEEDLDALLEAERAKRGNAVIQDEIFKIYLPNGAYKSIKVTSADTAEVVCETLADKLSLPKNYGKYFAMFERVKDRERKLQAGENLFECRRNWPLIFGETGNETKNNCYFFVTALLTAPEKVRQLVGAV